MSVKNEPGWKDIPIGGLILEAGNATNYNTGNWRSKRPIRDEEKCSHCLLCWIYCPDSSVIVKDEKVVDIDLKHCKGCGICSQICPRKAIHMVDE